MAVPAGVVRASSIFPILSAVLLLLGGLCVAASRLRRARTSLVLGAGILFVAAGTGGPWGGPDPIGLSMGGPDPTTFSMGGSRSHWGTPGGVLSPL